MEEINHLCRINHPSHLEDRSHSGRYEATANETLPRAFVWTANPVHFQKARLLERDSVDTFSAGFVMLVFVGPGSHQPGTWQDD